jgi:AcrR family transcriptional regulator
MPRPADANAELRDHRREEILHAAVRVFATRGLGDATISEIARAAGLSHGLVYHYFPSKDALVEALFEQKTGQIRAILAATQADTGPVVPRLERACAAMLAHIQADPDLAAFVTQAIVSRAAPDAVRARMQAHARLALGGLASLIAEGQRTGEIACDASPEALATATAALIRGLALFHEVRLPEAPCAPPADIIARLLRPAPRSSEKPSASPRDPLPRKRPPRRGIDPPGAEAPEPPAAPLARTPRSSRGEPVKQAAVKQAAVKQAAVKQPAAEQAAAKRPTPSKDKAFQPARMDPRPAQSRPTRSRKESR